MDNENLFENIKRNFLLPAQVYTVFLVDSGKTKILTKEDQEKYESLFLWVDQDKLTRTLSKLHEITKANELSVVAVYGDAQKIEVYAQQPIGFEPPPL